MRILVADDDLFYRQLLEATLTAWGYEVTVVSDGVAACNVLEGDKVPNLAIIDWMMPGNDGLQVCQKVRQTSGLQPVYLILLTARAEKKDIVTGLGSGADDYLIKPFDQDELQARLLVGKRIIELQQCLANRVRELTGALASVKQLQGLLPICSYCKCIRDDQNYWRQVEDYISTHSEAQFSHGVCPACYKKCLEPDLNSFLCEGKRT